MERVTYNCSAMPVTPQQGTKEQAGRYEGELNARKRARSVRWRGKILSSFGDMLIPLSFKWNRTCAYCGKQDVPLQVEHIHPRANGGTHRLSNLTLACEKCNQAKGAQDIRGFLASKPDVLKRILAQAKAPLKDTSAVNTTRWALHERLKPFGLPVEWGTGGRTKYNRTMRNLPKTHWIDAACVGASTPEHLDIRFVVPLVIKATGHGNRQMCGTDKFGFPTRHRQRQKRYFGFQTGDMVQAVVPKGKKAGRHIGRVLVRASGSFDIVTKHGRVQGIGYRICNVRYHSDGYQYEEGRGGNSSLGLKAQGFLATSQ